MSDTTNSLMQHFDLSVRDQIEMALLNGAGDCFFLFSGPPSFAGIGSGDISGITGLSTDLSAGSICPLLFTTSFTDPDGRPPDRPMQTLGSNKTIVSPSFSNPGLRSVSVGAFSLVTSKPGRGANTTDFGEEKWNLLKRIYYWAITNTETDVSAYFGDGGKLYANEAENPNAVAPDFNSPWGNFSRSFVYKLPFGLLAAAYSKTGSPLTVKYYQGCVLQNVGPQLATGVDSPTMVSGSSGFTATFTTVKTFTLEDAKKLMTGSSSSEADFFSAMYSFFKDTV